MWWRRRLRCTRTTGGWFRSWLRGEHLRNIVPVVRAAMAEAGVGFADLDAIAVTEGPGLAGALLVGITYAKALALALGKPLIAVNHLEGHIHAVLMEANRVFPPFPQKAQEGWGTRAGDADAGAGGEWGAHASVSGGIRSRTWAHPEI